MKILVVNIFSSEKSAMRYIDYNVLMLLSVGRANSDLAHSRDKLYIRNYIGLEIGCPLWKILIDYQWLSQYQIRLCSVNC